MQNHPALDWFFRQADFAGGVDLFFAISGFVIARSLLGELLACRGWAGFIATAWAFWLRRAWRLLPSAWLWLALCLLLSASFNRSGIFQSVRTNSWAMLAGMLDFANLRLALLFGVAPYGTSYAWWSLSLEEQFYLLLPPVAFLAGRFLPLLLIGLVAAQFGQRRTILLMMFRSDAILLGVLLAWWASLPGFARVRQALRVLPGWAGRMAAAGLFAGLGIVGTRNPYWDRFTVNIIALISVALVFLAVQNRGFILPPGRPRQLLEWIGTRSYGLYLIHLPAFCAVHEIWFRAGKPAADGALVLASVGLTLALAELNWRLVEQPCRLYGARMAGRRREDVLF